MPRVIEYDANGQMIDYANKRYTIADVKAANERIGHFFFSPSTLKFFGQRVSMFKIRHVAGRVFVFAPRSRSAGPGEGKRRVSMGYSFAEFHPETGDIGRPWPGPDGDSLADIEIFLEGLKD